MQDTLLAQGTAAQTALTRIDGKKDGATLFVIGGIHGDEQAGWMAAEQLRSEVRIESGTLYILSPANAYGAQHLVRPLADRWDLNRIFPGDADGGDGEKLAHEIFSAIEQASPDLVLDLHEALPRRENRDYLGGSIIFTSMDNMEAFILSLLEQSESGALCSTPLNYFSGAPRGSLNRVVTETLGIPVLTVETFRGDPLERRIADHLSILHFALQYYSLESE